MNEVTCHATNRLLEETRSGQASRVEADGARGRGSSAAQTGETSATNVVHCYEFPQGNMKWPPNVGQVLGLNKVGKRRASPLWRCRTANLGPVLTPDHPGMNLFAASTN